MCEAIVPIEAIQRKARVAFAAGLGSDANPFNWHAPAHETWKAEFDRLDKAEGELVARLARIVAGDAGKASQQSHGAPAGGRRVDADWVAA